MKFIYTVFLSLFLQACATSSGFDKNIIETKNGKNVIIKENSEFCKNVVSDFDKFYQKIDSLRNNSNKLAYSCIKQAERNPEIEKYIPEYKSIKRQFIEYKNKDMFIGYQLDKCFGSSFKAFLSTSYNSMSQSFSLSYEYCSKKVEDIFVNSISEEDYTKRLDNYFKTNIED